jgi:polyhydroxybutyrate depolymerase
MLVVGLLSAFTLDACGHDNAVSTPIPDGASADASVLDTSDGSNTVDPTDAGDSATVVPPKPSKVNVTTEAMIVADVPRSYVLSVPKTYDPARAYPLIVALHGDGQTADGFRTFLGLDDVAGNDAITAYTDQVLDLGTPFDQNGDQQFVAAVIGAVKAKRNIDPAKVWGLGYSKGGFILNELACRKPGMFKAIAAHASGAPARAQPGDRFPTCDGVVGIPVLTSEGDQDKNIGAEDAANCWSHFNACGEGRSPIAPTGCQKAIGCPADKPVVYCLAAGLGHYPIWSGAAAASWDFFRALQ